MQPHERIYVALDTNNLTKARGIVDELKGKVGGFKIGLEFITSVFVRLIRGGDRSLLHDLQELFMSMGNDVFWDGKFDDIPNTIAGAAAGLKPLSPKFFNVHASAGILAMEEAVANRGESKVLAVTLLTSINEGWSTALFGAEPKIIVGRWAWHAYNANVDGLICSPADLEQLKEWSDHEEEGFLNMPKMCPGIRPSWSETGDQSRIMTPAQAVKTGVTWMVIGRPITKYPEGPEKAVERIVDEISAAQA